MATFFVWGRASQGIVTAMTRRTLDGIAKKKTRTLVAKRKRATGSLAANPHEGSRSEYLAQYVFAGFGTAIAVPHQEDSGIDLHCTITETVGKRAWTRAYFSVQVKSTDGPWEFSGKESVRWLLDHPTPLFLCVVEKKELRLRVYQTSARLSSSLQSPEPEEVVLLPGKGSKGETLDRTAPGTYSLSAPIINYTVSELLDAATAKRARGCLEAWAAIDSENIRRRSRGINSVTVPNRYVTNEIPFSNTREGDGTVTLLAPSSATAIPKLIETLADLGSADGSVLSETTQALINMLLRDLTRGDVSPRTLVRINMMMNERMKMNAERLQAPYLFAAVDRLIEHVRVTIEQK